MYQKTTLQFFLHPSAPLSRLSPNEALPQTPQGLCPLTPQWVSPLDPDQGRVPGPFARFARCFILLYACNLLWSALPIPHSSLLTPHLNSAPIKNLPLIIPPKSAILLISKIARNHNHKEVNFYELYSFQKLLSVL